ncbi:MAG: TonB-dependent receptor plug domain-containing protein [Lachnospiraceae bacterium]|nr:TonB-dependent receptor plug domain-containing protein [Lachnospiraceae bacterium]
MITDDKGLAVFEDVAPGAYTIEVSFMAHTFKKKILVGQAKEQTVNMQADIDPNTLKEVVITAKEGGQMTSSSVIGREAIGHIQPSSFADLLELIPGGSAKDPKFGSAQTIRLREADPVSSYSTSSLGTQFMVDGVPMSNDANMQRTPISTNIGNSFTSEGIDMRTISTDNVEKVEIVRGIPSVEYGDLTSGLVKIERKRGGNNIDARFKADMSSKLFSLGKGFEWGAGTPGRFTLNADLSYLDAANDPRNTRQNYKRLTGSLRSQKQFGDPSGYSFRIGAAIDYTGSFDNVKSDRDLNDGNGGPIETYKSTYNRFAASLDFKMLSGFERFFRSLDFTASYTSENDRIDRWKIVELGMDTPVCTATTPGRHDATIVPYAYESTLTVEGKPVYAYANLVSNWGFTPGNQDIGFKLGGNWSMSKNNGRGSIFDLSRPFSIDMNVRPRVFKDIPAINQGHVFVENNTMLHFGGFTARIMAGVRAMTLLGLDSKYSLAGSWKFDPRANVRIEMPGFDLGGRQFKAAIAAGWGRHTKFPTAEQLYPDPIWYDINEMNYWPSDPALRRVVANVYKTDPTNFQLDAARNEKAEITLDLSWNGYMISTTVFREDMTSGFRNSNLPHIYNYRTYDITGIDQSALGGMPPQLENIPYTDEALIVAHNFVNNGSRTLKTGVEFTLATPRYRAIATRFSVSGAYFRTRYQNSQPEYYKPSSSVGGKAYPYIGYYANTDNYLRERFNTNFNTDTQVPRFGLIFSTSFQCVWFTGSQSQWRDPKPLEYVDNQGNRYPFTDASAEDGVLQQLIRSYNQVSYMYNRVPFCMNINLKVSKTLYGDRIALALFANKLLDISPSYRSALGVKVRREVNPYFGMELNFKI